MSNYDFKSLSPSDFEELTRDLLERHFGVPFQSFTNGRDKGIDLRHAPTDGKDWIVQCKHFAVSGYRKLKSHLKNKEVPKITALSPSRYIVTTSVGLSPSNVDELFTILSPYCHSKHDIIGCDELNAFLRDYPEIEKKHFKLWITSEAVLSRVLHNDLFVQASMERENVKRRLSLYVYTSAFDKARSMLEKTRICILSGVPGVGKTTLAEMIIVAYLDKGWNLVSIHQNVSEGLRALENDVKGKQVFYYDDFLGQISSGEKLAKNEDSSLLKLMRSIESNPRKRFILTTREYILQQAKRVHGKLAESEIDIYRFVVDCEEYTDYEKTRILANHLYFFGVPQRHIAALVEGAKYRQIISHRNYSPRIIEWMTGSKETQKCSSAKYPSVFLEMLENPERIWRHAFDEQLSEAARHLLMVLATCGEAVRFDDLEKAFADFFLWRANRFGITRQSADFRHALDELEGNFIQIHQDATGRVIQFHNPSIQDFLRCELRERYEDVADLVITSISFEQISRLCLVFEVFNSGKPLDSEFALKLIDAIKRTVSKSSIEVSKSFDQQWRSSPHRWAHRLRACIDIADSVSNAMVQEAVLDIVRQSFDHLSWIEQRTSVAEKLDACDWCDGITRDYCHAQIKSYLLEQAEDFEVAIDGIPAAASWIVNSSSCLSEDERSRLLEAVRGAVTKEAEDARLESDPDHVGSSLAYIEETGTILGETFDDETQLLKERLAEIGPRPDLGENEDWKEHSASASASCDSSITSLFDSLLE